MTPPAGRSGGMAASALLLRHDAADELARRDERTIDDVDRKRGEMPLRRPEDDPRALARIVFRIVAETLQDLNAVRLHPPRDGASGMRADSGIGEDALCR